MVVICKSPYTNDQYESYFQRYNFPLSDFQKYAIEAIVQEQHVLITAHTGSGKTLPAEFAIQYLFEKGRKVIYTSPIKALSNQKFYDFTRKFPHIKFGLFTGDIKTNPEADVIIMTTEILMNTLFNQNNTNHTLQFQIDFETELGAVVFDEIHYINDEERGQVWEKAIVMLPPHIQMIMLSATIDDPVRFANWCEETKQSSKKVHLSSTNHRVVPLSHYNYLSISESTLKSIKNKETQKTLRNYCNKLQCIKNDRGVFQVKQYNELVHHAQLLESVKSFAKRKYVLNNLVHYLRDNTMLPAIGFIFSRKQVEQCAKEITTPLLEDDSKIPYTVKRECDQIIRRLPNHEEYTRLPEYTELVSLLEKGIGIHHSGMIPILREIVEICISKNYIKLLFATESFAIGLDCPIKTAIFISMNKFDGNNDRSLYPHEYTQMAGRAGRRGIDTVGYVVHCNNLFSIPTETNYREIMSGNPPKLVSKYKISYDMILNVLHSNPESKLETLVAFCSRSMMNEELQKKIKAQHSVVLRQSEPQNQNKDFISNTPYEVCVEYAQLETTVKTAANKKKKDSIRRMEQIQQEYRTIDQDMIHWRQFEKTKDEQAQEIEYMNYLETFITVKIESICTILQTQGFIRENYQLTILGTISSYIAEIDSVMWMKCIVETWNYFEHFSAKQIIGLFSCATDIKVNNEYRISVPRTTDDFLQERVNELKYLYETYATIETTARISSGIHYDAPLVYDIIDDAMAWCDCSTEEECKMFINTNLNNKGIAIGDFTKAMMKVATIAREMQTIEEIEECKHQIQFIHKLSQIEDMVLKYIATNQSLYV
jgi:superfamily II RNA helicase